MFCSNCGKKCENGEMICQSCKIQIASDNQEKVHAETATDSEEDNKIVSMMSIENNVSYKAISSIAAIIVGGIFIGSVHNNIYINTGTEIDIDFYSVIFLFCGISLIIGGALKFLAIILNDRNLTANNSRAGRFFQNLIKFSEWFFSSIFEFAIIGFWSMIFFFLTCEALRTWEDDGAFLFFLMLFFWFGIVMFIVKEIKEIIRIFSDK